MRLAIRRLARAAIIAAAIVASSSTLAATGQPVLARLGEVAFNLAAAFSEAGKVRRKMTEALLMAAERHDWPAVKTALGTSRQAGSSRVDVGLR